MALGVIVYRASELGRCIRASVAEQLGMKPLPPPAWLQGVYDGGNEHEDMCILALRREGYLVTDGQREVVLRVGDDVEVIGHLDGQVGGSYVLDDPGYVLEIKSPNAYAKFEKAYKTDDWSDPLCARYAWQISTYMVATGLEAVVACLDGEVVKTFGVEIPPHSRQEIIERVKLIESLTTLPDICSQADGAGCPFRYLHGDEVEIIEDPVADVLVAEYERNREMKKLAEVNMKNLSGDLTAHLAGRDSITTERVKVTRYTTERKTLEKERMVEDGVDVAKYEKVSISESLRVTMRGTDAEAT